MYTDFNIFLTAKMSLAERCVPIVKTIDHSAVMEETLVNHLRDEVPNITA